METLGKIYLSVHALVWLDFPPGDSRRREPGWEQFPRRCELSYQAELEQKERIYRLIREAGEDEGVGGAVFSACTRSPTRLKSPMCSKVGTRPTSLKK